jgi:endonuclease/exonuclease/phosphatase family metal-dependent hydrolase
MVYLTLILLGAVVLAAIQYNDTADEESVRVMTYNIRFDNPLDGENRWEFRKERLAQVILSHQPDVLGVQEALHHQVLDLAGFLNEYAWYGAGREDGVEKGEFMAIYFKTSRFEMLKNGTFWLSPTTDQPSKGWDADVIRVCSWVMLREKKSQRIFFHFNTHFDHLGRRAREECAKLLLERIPRLNEGFPVVVSGDFNDSPESGFYREIVQGDLLNDAKAITQTPHEGPNGTWSTFEVEKGVGNQIDFIFVSSPVEVNRHAILTDSYEGRYPSDHLPILADILFREPDLLGDRS